MANISITSLCNHACTYCFAQVSHTESPAKNTFMSLDMFHRSLTFLSSSGIKDLSILGGEPTLHPQFCDFIDAALSCFDSVMVFTNGDMPARAREYLAGAPNGRVIVLVNLTDCITLPDGVEKTLLALGKRCISGITIYRPDIEMDFLLEIVEGFGLKIGFALDLLILTQREKTAPFCHAVISASVDGSLVLPNVLTIWA